MRLLFLFLFRVTGREITDAIAVKPSGSKDLTHYVAITIKSIIQFLATVRSKQQLNLITNSSFK
jgi:hypothetical protein